MTMKSPNSKGEAPVKLAVVLIVVIVVAGLVVALKPWEWPNSSGGTVRFYSRAYFYFMGAGDNGSLENVTLAFPDSNLSDNKILNRDYITDGYWTLHAYVDNEPVVEIRALTVVQLVAPRTSEPVISSMGANTSVWGPKYSFTEIDCLYPGEILEIQLWWEIPADMADRLTLEDTGLEGYPTYALVYSDPAKNINGSLFAGLYKLNDDNTIQQVVEEFGYTLENEFSQFWWGLEPI